MKKNLIEIYSNKVIGQNIDVDGLYGAQCR